MKYYLVSDLRLDKASYTFVGRIYLQALSESAEPPMSHYKEISRRTVAQILKHLLPHTNIQANWTWLKRKHFWYPLWIHYYSD